MDYCLLRFKPKQVQTEPKLKPASKRVKRFNLIVFIKFSFIESKITQLEPIQFGLYLKSSKIELKILVRFKLYR